MDTTKLCRQAIAYVISHPKNNKTNSYPQIVKRCVAWTYFRTELYNKQDIKDIVIKELDKLSWEIEFKPRTKIAKLCLALRITYILNGGKLYTIDEILEGLNK